MPSSSNRLRFVFAWVFESVYTYNHLNSVTVMLLQGFERMFTGVTSRNQALEVENTRLKEAICLPDTQVFCVQYVCASNRILSMFVLHLDVCV